MGLETLCSAQRLTHSGTMGAISPFAFLPFLKLPTAASGIGNDHVEFTMNAPYTIALSKPWSLTLEPNVGILRNFDNTTYREDYGLIVNLNRPISIKELTAAVEFAVMPALKEQTRRR
jgi:hypothetical protein